MEETGTSSPAIGSALEPGRHSGRQGRRPRPLRAPGRHRGLAPVHAEKPVALGVPRRCRARPPGLPGRTNPRASSAVPQKRRGVIPGPSRAMGSKLGGRPRLWPHRTSRSLGLPPAGPLWPPSLRPDPPRRPPGRHSVPPSRSGPHPLPMASTGSPAAGAAQSVTPGSGGRSRRRRCEQMALKKTQEPAARAHIQLASARRATPPPSPWPRRRLATRAGGGPSTSRLATEPSFFSNDLHALGAQLGFLRSRFRPLTTPRAISRLIRGSGKGISGPFVPGEGLELRVSSLCASLPWA